jgi:hypothetical protein
LSNALSPLSPSAISESRGFFGWGIFVGGSFYFVDNRSNDSDSRLLGRKLKCKKSVFLVIFLVCYINIFGQNYNSALAINREKLRQIMVKESVSAISIAVIKNGKSLWNEPFGLSNIETNSPANVQTKFGAALIDEGFLRKKSLDEFFQLADTSSGKNSFCARFSGGQNGVWQRSYPSTRWRRGNFIGFIH